MANRWDEQYAAWLDVRAEFRALLPPPEAEDEKEKHDRFAAAEAAYASASEDLFRVLRPIIKRAAVYTMGSWPAIAACTDADDLAAGVEYNLVHKPPEFLTEAFIRKQLRNRAYDLKLKLQQSDVVSLDRHNPDDDDGPDGGSRIPNPPQDAEWPWFATLPEPFRGNIALFKHIKQLVDDDNDARIYSLTGWFSGVVGDGVRQKNRRETERAKERGLDSALSQTGKVIQEEVNLVNAEMLGTHSALTVSVRTLCPEPCKEENPFPPDNVEMMSQKISGGSDLAVANWVIDSLSGKEAAVPDKLAKCVEKFLGAQAEPSDCRYFRDSVSLYLRAYSILLLPLKGSDAEGHWTDIAAPMTPVYADFAKYRSRAKGYHCLETYLPKLTKGNYAHD